MMPSLDEVLAFTTQVPGYYSEQEISKLYECVAGLPDYAHIVELGVQYGRSASVYFQVAKYKPLYITLVDNWSEGGLEARLGFDDLAQKFLGVPFAMLNMSTKEAALLIWRNAELLHIDAGHDKKSIWQDCILWLPMLFHGGRVLFHDYDRRGPDGKEEVFPAIKAAVDFYCNSWENLGVYDTLAIRRKS